MILIKKKITLLKILKKKTIILFTANWCTPCLIMKKKINILEKKTNIIFLNSNIDYFNNILIKLNIKNIPCLLINLNNKKIITGNISISNLIKTINVFI